MGPGSLQVASMSAEEAIAQRGRMISELLRSSNSWRNQ
jgi:hypothetical protein